jgi:predicted metal-dependent phosphoesterase TrpH
MVVADLHMHTPNSDGTLALNEVPAAAREAGLDAVAVTDHDRVHPDLDAPVSERGGITIVHGIELRVQADEQRVDLLGYGVRRTEALLAEVKRLQRDRVARGRAIVERVEDRLGHPIQVDIEPGLGRPDIARGVVESDRGYDDIGTVFDDLIGEAAPCYVSRDVPSFERGWDVLGGACAVVGLAHPLRYPAPEAALSIATSLDAVEVHYPYDGSRGHRRAGGDLDRGDVSQFAERHDLLVTGGSDAHGTDLGRTGVSRAVYDRFAAALEGR